MSRTPVVSGYAFTAADGTNVSALNSGNDWVEQNGSNSQLRVITNLFHSAFGPFSDCAWKGAGVVTITGNQYFELTITASAFHNNDQMGGSLLNNSGAFGSHSMYRVYLADGSPQTVEIDRVVNGTPTSILVVTANGSTLPNWATGNKLSCEVQIVAGSPVFQIYQDTGSGPVAYGSPVTDSNAAKRTSGVFGITAATSADTLRGGPYTAGNISVATAVVLGIPTGVSPGIAF